jgi:hypothetical protein
VTLSFWLIGSPSPRSRSTRRYASGVTLSFWPASFARSADTRWLIDRATLVG